jgi:hypothetical protein
MSSEKNSDQVCYCGHAEDEHGGDPKYPKGTGCNVENCGCISYEHDPGEAPA